MRKTVLVIGLSLMTLSAIAQKKEIRKANKAVDSGDFSTALSELSAAEGQLESANDDMKAEFYLLKGKAVYSSAPGNLKNVKEAVSYLEEAKSYNPKSSIASEIAQFTNQITDELVNSAIEDQNASKNQSAADKLMEVYNLNKDTNQTYLYYAASNYHNAQELDKALEGYQELIDLGYTGVEKQYFAVEKESGEKQPFADEAQRKLMIQAGTHTDPTDEVSEDVTPQILQYIALIHIYNEDFEDAIEIMDNALESDPENTTLLRGKADVVYQLGDKAEYKRLMKQIVALDPNNPELLFNLGVSSAELGETEEALDYYMQTLEIDKDHYAANLNAAVLILAKDEVLVEEMNSLGMTKADNVRYGELQEERKELMNEAIPYLEAAVRIDDSDLEIKRTLSNVYSQVGENEKADAILEGIEE